MASSPGSDSRVGTVVAGYQLEQLIGRGGMSLVFRAEDLALGRRVALKLISPELAASRGFRERFRQESRIAASIDHPNVVPIFEAGEADGELFIAMRYVDGTDLKAMLAEQGALDPHRAVDVVSQIAAGLDAAHRRGLVHRDVKPSNVLCARDEERLHVYLADFGLTRSAGSDEETGPGSTLSGSTDYVSPEQIEEGTATAGSDVYALGCVLYECLTGRVPFPAEEELRVLWAHLQEAPPRPSEVDPSLSQDFDAVVATALAKSPDERYASAGALAEAAQGALDPGGARGSLRRRTVGAVLFAAIAAAVAIPAVLLLGRTTSPAAAGEPTLDIRVDAVQRIDAERGALVATTPIGFGVGDIAIDALTGSPLVVQALENGYRVHRIDPESNGVADATTVAAGPYVASSNSGQTDLGTIASGSSSSWINSSDPSNPNLSDLSVLTEIDGAAGAVRGRASLGVSPGGAWKWDGAETGFRVSQDHPRFVSDLAVISGQSQESVLVASPNDRAVLVVRRRGSDHIVEASHRVDGPPPLALATDGLTVWIAQFGAALRLDVRTGEVTARVELPFLPGDIALTEDALWIVSPLEDSVWRIDPNQAKVVSTVAVGDGPSELAVAGRDLWVAETRGRTISRIDTSSDLVVATVEVGGRPEAIATNGADVWVAVHPLEAGSTPLAKAEYTAALRRLDDAWSLRFMAVLGTVGPLLEFGARDWMQAGGKVLAENLVDQRKELVADLAALTPPEVFADDHALLLEMHRAALAGEERFAAGIRSGDVADAIAATSQRCERCPGLRTRMSPEFRELTWLEFFV